LEEYSSSFCCQTFRSCDGWWRRGWVWKIHSPTYSQQKSG